MDQSTTRWMRGRYEGGSPERRPLRRFVIGCKTPIDLRLRNERFEDGWSVRSSPEIDWFRGSCGKGEGDFVSGSGGFVGGHDNL